MDTVLTVIGLIFNTIGALMLWRYGLPASINRSGHISLVLEQEDEAQKVAAVRYDRLAKIAALLLVIGFALQLVGTLL